MNKCEKIYIYILIAIHMNRRLKASRSLHHPHHPSRVDQRVVEGLHPDGRCSGEDPGICSRQEPTSHTTQRHAGGTDGVLPQETVGW